MFAHRGHPQLRLDQAMCIRTASDEAGFAIGLGATFAWLIERVAVSLLVLADLARLVMLSPLARLRIGWPAVAAMFAWYVALSAALFVVLLPGASFRPAAYVVFGIAGVWLLPGLLLLPFVLLLSLCYIPFGHDLALCTPFLRATVEAAPTGIWHIFQFPNLVTLPLFKMQHSFVYEHTPLRVFIARWLVSGEFVSMREWREA